MIAPREPFEPRRRKELLAELISRARAWIPDWHPRADGTDVIGAVLGIATRLEAEVTQRLDRAPEKTFRGFLDWLALRGDPATAARMPVVFQVAAGTASPIDTDPPVQVRAAVGTQPVAFETIAPLRIVPASIVSLVAADPQNDAYFLPPGPVLVLAPPATVPGEWELLSRLAEDGTVIQVAPAAGLAVETILRVEKSAALHRVTAVDEDLVTLDPGLAPEVAVRDRLSLQTECEAFAPTQVNRQGHALYIGSETGLEIAADATIEVVNGMGISGDWSFWGKPAPSAPAQWVPVKSAVPGPESMVLTTSGAFEKTKLDDRESRWLRVVHAPGVSASSRVSALRLRINCPTTPASDSTRAAVTSDPAAKPVAVEAMANSTPLALDPGGFKPFGDRVRLFDTFYIGSTEAFSKPLAKVVVAIGIKSGSGSRSQKPQLQWEYWTGNNWWLLPLDGPPGLFVEVTSTIAPAEDAGTDASTTMVFQVPRDLSATTVNGRTNYWIRGRVIGGVEIERDNERGIAEPPRGPVLNSLSVTYQLCCPVVPQFVLASDAGTTVDRSAANRADDGIVEYFVPLSETLGQFPEAGGSTGGVGLYLGFDQPFAGGPVQLLFLVEEGAADAGYPLRVDVLTAAGFQPVLVSDPTRGLNETGVVALFLSEPPQQALLFGQSRYWLRVRPAAGTDTWLPRLRKVFVNGTWVVATETLGPERLTVSDGSPGQELVLARTPLVAESLRLRVPEPLGDDEIAELDHQDPVPAPETGAPASTLRVLETLDGLSGAWVLWEQVIDVADAGPLDRVYSCDEITGHLRFGDSMHGMIPPPVGLPVIAERYQRGGGEEANAVTAWTPLSLATPLVGVQAVQAPDDAAGGTDSEAAEAILSAAPGLVRRRGRTLTLVDFEQAALRSRAVAQARALPTRTGLRLVAVAHAEDVQPSRALRRELARDLTAAASPAWAVPGAITVSGPEEVRIRVHLTLGILSVDASGDAAHGATQALLLLFDPATGGLDGAGWPLGARPTPTDVAAALSGIVSIERLQDAALRRVDDAGAELELPESLRPDQLVRLAQDGVRIELAIVGAEATP